MDNILCLIAWSQVSDREGLRQGGDRIPGGAGNVVVGGAGEGDKSIVERVVRSTSVRSPTGRWC